MRRGYIRKESACGRGAETCRFIEFLAGPSDSGEAPGVTKPCGDHSVAGRDGRSTAQAHANPSARRLIRGSEGFGTRMLSVVKDGTYAPDL